VFEYLRSNPLPPPLKKEGEINVIQKTSIEVLNPAELLELEVSLEQVSN
jgi:hypothetical protein